MSVVILGLEMLLLGSLGEMLLGMVLVGVELLMPRVLHVVSCRSMWHGEAVVVLQRGMARRSGTVRGNLRGALGIVESIATGCIG